MEASAMEASVMGSPRLAHISGNACHANVTHSERGEKRLSLYRQRKSLERYRNPGGATNRVEGSRSHHTDEPAGDVLRPGQPPDRPCVPVEEGGWRLPAPDLDGGRRSGERRRARVAGGRREARRPRDAGFREPPRVVD